MITSRQNEQVKRVRALQGQHSARLDAGLFVIEGPTLVREAVESGVILDAVFYTESFSAATEGANLLPKLRAASSLFEEVSDAVMKSMSDTVTPQGILAVAALPEHPIPQPLTFALIVDAVSDPGNMGAILRTAAGAGVRVVFVMPGSVDVYSPKVVRSAMGAHFRLGIHSINWDTLPGALGDLPVFLADSGEGIPCFDLDWTQPCALIVSGEAHGPSPEARQSAAKSVTIPMPGHIESLNVAMATGILLFEMVRQRRLTGENIK